jgi:hypothetical protein
MRWIVARAPAKRDRDNLSGKNILKMLTRLRSLAQQIKLPRYRKIALGYEPTYYGAAANIARQLGLKSTTPHHCHVWSHGCRLLDAEDVRYYIRYPELSGNVLVARRTEATFLSANGIGGVYAVGLPICYAKPSSVPRARGSLLVMPPHATYHSRSSNALCDYLEYIKNIRHRFSRVACCLSRQCLQVKAVRKLFEGAGIPVVCGSAIDDGNSLARTRHLLEAFDYVTTNTLGSHLAYAMAFGAKVSIAGPLHTPSSDDAANEPFYRENPDLNDSAYRKLRQRRLEEMFAELKVEPWHAQAHAEWGRSLIGLKNVMSPREIGKLLGLQGA